MNPRPSCRCIYPPVKILRGERIPQIPCVYGFWLVVSGQPCRVVSTDRHDSGFDFPAVLSVEIISSAQSCRANPRPSCPVSGPALLPSPAGWPDLPRYRSRFDFADLVSANAGFADADFLRHLAHRHLCREVRRDCRRELLQVRPVDAFRLGVFQVVRLAELRARNRPKNFTASSAHRRAQKPFRQRRDVGIELVDCFEPVVS